MKKELWVSAITLIVAALTFSCAPLNVSGPSSTGKGVLQVYVTDALPKEVTAVEVKAKSIEVHKSDASEDSWITVLEDPGVFDLVKIAGVNALLGTSELPSGSYTQVRLDISEVNVMLNGKQVKATVPGDKLKLVGTFIIEEGKKTPITIDFDGEKSVVLAGNDKVMLKPVVKLIVGNPESTPATPTTTPTSTP